ncbi:hypothetical protein [Gracilibacillus phocaeensis]|nr:hypothetical protein [Gracilibacillus phocaeensis]
MIDGIDGTSHLAGEDWFLPSELDSFLYYRLVLAVNEGVRCAIL